ncbi:hypothetical protein LTR09_003866 [Extremus antarcticus]|uniref:Uncharacterized protein n=1 Tax=Extremus antarcticus TaxID=702011 RepID=A0AAJ0DJT0_9PEZI|nr:hypothetical protein LTR09_003866 [Extremus antarcticus]
MTFNDAEEGTTGASPATINCALSSSSPFITAATCTGRSAISGLGDVMTTSTLEPSQLMYATVTVTAGVEKLERVDEGNGGNGGGSSTSSGMGARATAGLGWAVGGVVGMMGLVGRL